MRFPNESLNCCHSGKVRLPPLESYPMELKDLLTSITTESCNFHDSIRQYSSAFSFASFGSQTVQVSDVYHFTHMIILLHMFHLYICIMLQVPGQGPYCFKIHGQTYHSTATLHPPEGQDRRYGQLYIIEGDQAVTTCMNADPNSQCLRIVMN